MTPFTGTTARRARPALALAALLLLLGACSNRPDAASSPPVDIAAQRATPFVLVRAAGADAGRIDLVTYDPDTREPRSRRPTTLRCERVHLSADSVACMSYAPGMPGSSVLEVLGADLKPLLRYRVPQPSVISRTRLSRDGRHVGFTVFVAGHDYGTPGAFETVMTIIDVPERRIVVTTNGVVVSHEGRPIAGTPETSVKPTELNLWGSTFDPAQPDRFAMTVAIGGRPWLALGSLSKGAATTLRPDVECPSYSPDGRRIAFKKLRPDRQGWNPAVLDLATGTETVFADRRSIDDQIEWLDDDTIVYEVTETRAFGARTDVMIRDVRHPERAERVWIADAGSPASHRPAAARAAGDAAAADETAARR